MPLSLHLEPRANYLYVQVAGAYKFNEAQALSLRFLRASVEHRLSKVLVDVRLVLGILSVVERYHYSEFIAREVIALTVRSDRPALMLAYPGHEPLLDPGRFGLLVAHNRGVLATATENLDEALSWLGVAPPAP